MRTDPIMVILYSVQVLAFVMWIFSFLNEKKTKKDLKVTRIPDDKYLLQGGPFDGILVDADTIPKGLYSACYTCAGRIASYRLHNDLTRV